MSGCEHFQTVAVHTAAAWSQCETLKTQTTAGLAACRHRRHAKAAAGSARESHSRRLKQDFSQTHRRIAANVYRMGRNITETQINTNTNKHRHIHTTQCHGWQCSQLSGESKQRVVRAVPCTIRRQPPLRRRLWVRGVLQSPPAEPRRPPPTAGPWTAPSLHRTPPHCHVRRRHHGHHGHHGPALTPARRQDRAPVRHHRFPAQGLLQTPTLLTQQPQQTRWQRTEGVER